MVLGEKICIRCGRKTLGWHYGPDEVHLEDDGLCPDCRGDDIAAAELEDGETEFTREDEVRCPWCGKRVPHDSDERIFRDGGEESCPYCGRRYDVTANQYWTYDTRRVEAT